MGISIIIPTYNEAAGIAVLISYLFKHAQQQEIEVIVADGGSEDETVNIAKSHGAITLTSAIKGRAGQMNAGAGIARYPVLYFVHADTFPPTSYFADINNSIADNFQMGRYYTKFNSSKKILSLNAWFTRFDLFMCMGGDNTLFITKNLFHSLNGFNEEMKIMEEYEFCKRARKVAKYVIMNKATLVSARKYEKNSWLQVQQANIAVMRLYKNGASQDTLLGTYQNMLKYRGNSFDKKM